MITFQGKRVSRYWRRILVAAAKDVHFTLDSGQRTLLEQAYLYRHRGQPGFAKLVAFPSPTAPHIRVGRQDHCLDVDELDGGATRLAGWLARHGVHVKFNVAGEPWHMDPAGAGQLRALYIRLGKTKRVPAQAHLLGCSGEAVDLIASFEGLRLEAYRDAVGVWTIGYGHTHGVNAHTGRLGSAGAAKRLLRDDLPQYGGAVRHAVHVALTQEQFDACVSLAYNIGGGAFASSTLVKRLNKRQFARAANQFLVWDKAGGRTLLGLSRRRRAERGLFLRGSDAKTRRNARTGIR